MNTDSFLYYGHQSISQEDIAAFSKALASPTITRGPIVEEFEKSFVNYTGAQYAVAFNSGTAALMACYFAADISSVDRVFTTPNTFVATISAAIQKGATPIFIDIDTSTGNLKVEDLLFNVSEKRSRGKSFIVPVHFAGIPVDMEAIDAALCDPEAIVIEDAAHALGSCYKDGSRVGNCRWSHMTIFSFHPTKTITTGEGGMVTTNDPELYRKLKLFRNNGIEHHPAKGAWYYEIDSVTGNYNFTEFQAALGLSQMTRIDRFIEKRRELLAFYRDLLKDNCKITLLSPTEDVYVAPHLCVVKIDFEGLKTTRTAVMEKLKERGIGTQYHYIPLYRHPFISKTAGDLSPYFPETEKYYAQALSLPLYPDLTKDDVRRVVDTLNAILL